VDSGPSIAANDVIWRLRDVTLAGRTSPRLDHITCDIPRGITAVLGASGAGKTSLLNVLVGVEGRESRVERREPEKTGVRDSSLALVSRLSSLDLFWSPPDHGLWPQRTVRAHLTAVQPVSGTLPSVPDTFSHLLNDFGLLSLADAYPGTLSLGERSRLSVARAVASGARVLVLDEPFAHVDGPLRARLWLALRDAVRRQRQSVVLATHHPDVALALADQVICLDAGRVLTTGVPSDLYHRPPNRTVAELFGPCNWLEANDIPVWLPDATTACVRPEQLAIEPAATTPLRVESAIFCGDHEQVQLRHDPTGRRRRFLHRPSAPKLSVGQTVTLRLLSLWLALLCCAGCNVGVDQPLTLRTEEVWTLPPEGSKAPAPRAITAGPKGESFVLDNAGRVLVLDDQGQCVRQWWMPEHSVGKPERVLVCRDGTLAVADTHYHRVVVFDQTGQVKLMFGRKGEGPGEFIYPVAIAEDDAQNLYVCEYGGHDRVQVFRPEGTYVREFGNFGTEPGEFQRPSGILWRDGRLYIVDAFNNRVQVFHDDGRLVELPPGAFAAELHYPYDIAVDPQGTFFVVEYGAGRVTSFAADGTLRGRYGQSGGDAGQLSTPWGLSVDRQGRVLVADTGNRRVVRWTFAE
jgi:iron(III) transport system ATP-binding protein